MKNIAIATLLLAACTTPDDMPARPDAGVRILTQCGQAPQIPHWSYTVDPNDDTRVLVSTPVWNTHTAWVIAVTTWADCVEPLIEAQR